MRNSLYKLSFLWLTKAYSLIKQYSSVKKNCRLGEAKRNPTKLRKIVGWVKQSATQQSYGNVGFRSSNATCFKSVEMLGFVPQTPLASSRGKCWVSFLKRHLLQVGKNVGFRSSNATCFKSGNLLGFVPQTPLASSRETARAQWLPNLLLQVGKPQGRSGSPTYTFKSGNRKGAVAPQPTQPSRETARAQWLPNLHNLRFLILTELY